MQLDSIRELKQTLQLQDVLAVSAAEGGSMLAAGHPEAVVETEPTLALGAAPTGTPGDYKLAVSVQRPDLMASRELDRITEAARGEVEVAFVGPGFKQSGNTGRARPLEIGCSIGHPNITAGTLGCFVELPDDGLCVLSNNHVLADEDRAQPGSAIVQPGRSDGGAAPEDVIGTLARVIPLSVDARNRVDAATAAVHGVDVDPRRVPGLGDLQGSSELTGRESLAKVGRTSGLTRGRVFAIDVDGISVAYEKGTVVFDGVVQIEGTGGLFTRGGDSGSVVVTDDSAPYAVALHFAGLANGHAVCAPMTTVLAELGATLVR